MFVCLQWPENKLYYLWNSLWTCMCYEGQLLHAIFCCYKIEIRSLPSTYLIGSLPSTYLVGLLDLSAAFDCVDHSLLLLRLQRNFGLVDTVLKWFTSFVCGRTRRYRSTVICLQSCCSCTASRSLFSDLCCLSSTLPISAESSHSTVFHCTSTLTTVKSVFQRQSTTRQHRSIDSPAVLKTWMPG